MTSIPRRLRRARRRLTAGLASRAPVHVGPEVWTDLVAETRLRRAARHITSEPELTLAMIEPLLEHAPEPRTLLLAARTYEEMGDSRRAVALARAASEHPDHTVQVLADHRQIAQRTGHVEQLPWIVDALTRTRPRTAGEADIVTEALRGAPREVIESFAASTSGPAPDGVDTRELAQELLAEEDLVAAHAAGAEAFEATLDRVLHDRPRAVAVVTSALVRRRAWQQVADFVAVTPGSQRLGPRATGAFPTREVTQAATLALRAGHPRPAAMLAARALAASPRSRTAQETFTSAHDQLRVVRDGWSPPPAREQPEYEPDPRSALAVLSQSMPHTSGGYATRSHGILTGLAAGGRRIEAVTRLGFPYDRWSDRTTTVPPSDAVDGIVYHRLLDGRRRYPQHPIHDYVEQSADGIADLARAQRAALIHASSFYVTGMSGLTAARRLGIPFLYEMRGLEELMKVSRDPDFEGSGRQAFLDVVETGVAREADAALIITEALRTEMVARGVDEDRAFVVPNGVHTAAFRPQPRDRDLEARFGFEGKTVIGYVGGLVDYEGVDLLLEAVARLRAGRPDDFRVLVVGDGPHERVVRGAAVAGDLLDVVTFTGRVPHAQVGGYLSLVDIAPFPRRPLPVCEMISPIKPFESMAMAKAVVPSDVAALAEIVDDGVTGRLFRKGDAADLARVLSELIADPAQRARLGEAAREWVVRERDWESITRTVDAIYDEVLRRHAG